MPTAAALDAWLGDLEMEGKSPRTIASYRSYSKPLRAYADLAEVTDAVVRDLVRERLHNRRTAVTVRGVLNGFLTWCVHSGYLRANPAEHVPWPKAEPVPHRYADAALVRRIYEACRTDEARLIVRLLLLGLRASELLGLRWADVDMERKRLRVLKAKGRKPRTVGLDPGTLALLKAAMPPEGGSRDLMERHPAAILPCSYPALRGRIMRLGARAGAPWLRPHDFRRSWASLALLEGMSYQAVKQLGGWQGDGMLQRYARSVWEEAALREAERVGLTGRLLDETHPGD